MCGDEEGAAIKDDSAKYNFKIKSQSYSKFFN